MKKVPLQVHSKRMCGVIGVCWLAALLLRRWRLWDASAWLFGAGALLAVALLIMLAVQQRRESSSHSHDSSAHSDK